MVVAAIRLLNGIIRSYHLFLFAANNAWILITIRLAVYYVIRINYIHALANVQRLAM